jgi:ubiquinone biosynthesis UbiH/UbiF/VisC/COQ6 family hydroxylase
MANKFKTDVVVMGAGLVGLAAAIGLSTLGKQVVLVDAKPVDLKKMDDWDSRVYAITPAVKSWLQNMGVWSLVDNARVNDVEAMRLWGGVDETALELNANDANLLQLAYIIENQNLLTALWQRIKALGVTVVTDDYCQQIQHHENNIELYLESGAKVLANLLVAADGANSYVRKQLDITTNYKAFKQTGVVANFIAEQPHGNVARQWFLPHNTLALLPMPSKQVSMVWSVSTETAKELLKLTREELAEQVQMASGNSLGALDPTNEALAFALNQVTAQRFISERAILVGDAAHQIHPMAGQGVNLGFRDVIALQSMLRDAHVLQDIGELGFLRRYERSRKADVLAMNTLTSGLDYCFSLDQALAKKVRSWGMHQLNERVSIKEIFIKKAVA